MSGFKTVYDILKATYQFGKTAVGNTKRSKITPEDISLLKTNIKKNPKYTKLLETVADLNKNIKSSITSMEKNKINASTPYKTKNALKKAQNSLNANLKNLATKISKDEKVADALNVKKSPGEQFKKSLTTSKNKKQPPKKGLTKEERKLENQRQKDLKKQTIAQMKEDRLGGILGRTGRLTGVLPYSTLSRADNIYRIPRLAVTYGAGQELGLIDKNKGGDINEGLKKIPAGPEGAGLRALKRENPSLVREQFKYAKKGGKILAKKKKKKKVKYVGVGKALRGYGKVRRV
tara:strand:+ start:757 stop:1629 length:873 start_codon:yes stop_codon:yes gene_type:complete